MSGTYLFYFQYHIENAPLEVYSSEKAALDALDCQLQEEGVKVPSLLSAEESRPETDALDANDYLKKEARRKREEQMQGDDYRTNYIELGQPQPTTQSNRGDIPSSGIETCDGKISSTFVRTNL